MTTHKRKTRRQKTRRQKTGAKTGQPHATRVHTIEIDPLTGQLHVTGTGEEAKTR